MACYACSIVIFRYFQKSFLLQVFRLISNGYSLTNKQKAAFLTILGFFGRFLAIFYSVLQNDWI